jgi:phosphonate transport system substrate-binding protein
MELDKNGNPGYHSIIISSKESDIQTLDQARGKVFAFTNPDSTSGYLVPMAHFIHERKETPASFASRIIFAKTHNAVIQGIASGRFDIAATNDMDLQSSCASMAIDPQQFHVLWKSQLIPGAPFAARKDVPQYLKEAFLQALTSINHDKESLKKMQVGGYIPAKDSDYDLIRHLEAVKLR